MSGKANGYMRDQMPVCAEMVDALREVGLLDDESIRKAMKSGEAYFEEAGHVLGGVEKHAARVERERVHAEKVAQEAQTTRPQWVAIRRSRRQA